MDIVAKVERLEEIGERTEREWVNMSYDDKVFYVMTCREIKGELENVIKQIRPYADIPLEVIEREHMNSLCK